jgi:signal transduction histidine kinase
MSRTWILVVEDEGIVAADIQERLIRLGYAATIVSNGMDALGKVDERVPDLVLMDIRLPGELDGIETAVAIRKRFEVPVIFLTAFADDATVARAKAAQPFGYIIKPFEEKGLHTIIELAISKHQMEIAERSYAEEQKQLMQVQLLQSQKLESIGRLAAGILHEINTPTQYFRDNTRFLHRAFNSLRVLLRQYKALFDAVKSNKITPALIAEVEQVELSVEPDYLIEEIPSAITESMEGIERVVKIVQAMKEFSHPGREKKESVDLNKAIESTLTVAQSEWKSVAELITDFDSTLPLVPCVSGEFNQAILNLVVNAAHAIADVVGDSRSSKGIIRISTRRQSEWVEVRIRDNGTGIPQNLRPRVFEPFFTTKPVGKGSGQGLAIVRDIIEKKHGGTVTFETMEGQGTTFILRLPLTPP